MQRPWSTKLLFTLIAIIATPHLGHAILTPIYGGNWGGPGPNNGQFSSPYGVAVDSSASFVYVADYNNHRIQKFDTSQNHLISWGTNGGGDGQFNFPRGVAVDDSGNVYVADEQNHRIQKFDDVGGYITKWGSNGSLDGEFDFPVDIEIGPDGNVYVVDNGNNRVQVFDNSGGHIASYPVGNDPFGIGFHSSGDFYVVLNSEMQRYTAAGALVLTWGNNGSAPGQFSIAQYVDVDSDDNVYVSDSNNSRIQVFTDVGGFLLQFANGLFWNTGIAIDKNDRIYVSEANNHLVHIYNQELEITEDPPLYLGLWSGFNRPIGIDIDPVSGDIFVADANNDRVARFDSSGDLVMYIGSFGVGTGFLDEPRDVAVDSNGDFYVTDMLNARVQKYSADGTFLQVIGSSGSGPGQFNEPRGIAIGPSGDLYVCDENNYRIQRLTPAGGFVTEWGIQGGGPGQFESPEHIAVDASGNVYVSDQTQNRIQKFDANGAYLTEWGGSGSNHGQFTNPKGIAVDANGDIYVADGSNSRIQKFDANGNFITVWGTGGSGAGQFNLPSGLAFNSEGNLFITDETNHRITKFGRTGALSQSILDVGNDQGGQVRLNFLRSGFDFNYGQWTILQYEAFRRIDPLPGKVARDGRTSVVQGRMLSDPAILTQGWDFAGSIPAHQEREYNMIASTLADSTVSGQHHSVFFIRAVTSDPGTYFDSAPDSGYSLDNLAPMAPLQLAATPGSGVQLTWDEVEDIDLAYYALYRSTSPSFTPNPGNRIGVVADLMLTDDEVQAGTTYYYLATAVDQAGNESVASNEASATPTTSSTGSLPKAFMLMPNRPNPFNPATELAFALPRASDATLRIYDARGRVVRSFQWDALAAGHHAVRWDGRDDRGRAVVSGVYLYRFEADGFTATRRMTLLK